METVFADHLEKWRLCGNYNTSNEAINCQNFHIFYILVGGCEGGVLSESSSWLPWERKIIFVMIL